MKRVVITGPTGVIGSALVHKMIDENIEVYAVSRPKSKRLHQIPINPLVHIIECDLHTLKELPGLINTYCDAFFHLAWLGTADPRNRFDMYLQNENVRYALDAVEVAKKLQCKVFVGSGSQAEYGTKGGVLSPDTAANPVSGYGMAKLCAGQMTRYVCQSYGIRHIWPRILSVYGPNDGKQTLISVTIDNLMAGKQPSLTKGEQIWDYLYSEDAADALNEMALHGKDGAVYVLGSGQTKQLREFVEIIRDEINPNLPLGFGEVPYYPDQMMHLEADIDKLVEDTGWQPKTDFKTGIKAMLVKKR